MKLHWMMLIAAFSVSAIRAPAMGADLSVVFDGVKAAATPDEITLTGSESKRLYVGENPREYRVCVKWERRSAPLRVTADGRDWTLKPGDCEFVTGKRIHATPAQPLRGTAHIVATFHYEKPAGQ